MALCLEVAFGDVLMSENEFGPDANQICWTVESLEGWFTPQGVVVQTFETWAPGLDPTTEPNEGSIYTVHKQSAREVTLTAVAYSPAGPLGDLVFTAIRTMKAAMDDAIEGPVFMYADWNEGASQSQALVRANGVMKTEILGELTAVRFTVPLIAGNPDIYNLV